MEKNKHKPKKKKEKKEKKEKESACSYHKPSIVVSSSWFTYVIYVFIYLFLSVFPQTHV